VHNIHHSNKMNIQECNRVETIDYQGDLFRGLGFRASGGGWSGSGGGVCGLASFLSVSGRGPLFSSRKRHFKKCQVWYNPEV
jgi:hypothetical protein